MEHKAKELDPENILCEMEPSHSQLSKVSLKG